MKKTLAAVSALFLMAFGTSAIAQNEDGVGLSCADIEFHADVVARAGDIGQACRDVVDLNGAMYAKARVRLDHVRGNRTTFRFIYPDGSFGSSHSTDVGMDWRVTIEGREYRMRELSRGQELSLYLPSDRWEAHLSAPTSTFVAYTPAPIYAAEDILPSTAGPLPLFGLFGGLALFGASLIRIFRR